MFLYNLNAKDCITTLPKHVSIEQGDLQQVKVDEGLYRFNGHTNLAVILYKLYYIVQAFHKCNSLQLGRYKPSFPSTKELRGLSSPMDSISEQVCNCAGRSSKFSFPHAAGTCSAPQLLEPGGYEG